MTGVAPLGQKKAVSRLGYETTDEEQRRNWCFSLWLRLAQPGVVITRHHYRVDPNSSIYALTRYEPGIWRSNRSGLSWSSVYLHNDHLGTLRYLSDSGGNPTGPTVFSAFGEQISGATAEFGYAGAWGYRTAAYIAGPLHVGHRYYDPGSGRFLQRDPIGIDGGVNVYSYVEADPLSWVDPQGLAALTEKEIKEFGELCLQAPITGISEISQAIGIAPDVTRIWITEKLRSHVKDEHRDEDKGVVDPNCPECTRIKGIHDLPKRKNKTLRSRPVPTPPPPPRRPVQLPPKDNVH